MRFHAKKIPGIVLLMVVILVSSQGLAHEQSPGDQPSDAKRELPVAVPDLADIIPLATELSSRLAALENKVTGVLDVLEVERKYAVIEANLKDPASQLERLKDAKDYRFNKIVALREAIEQETELFEKNNKPLRKAIRELGAWRTEWLVEKKRWNQWQSSQLEVGAFDQLELTFAKANNTIDKALEIVLSQLKAMLTVQEKAGNIQMNLNALDAKINGLASVKRRGVMIDASPPMFSSRYVSQFSNQLWYALQQGLDEISWPESRFFARQGWVLFLQGFLSFVVIVAIYRKRQILKDIERWRFFAIRPFSAGLFFGSIVAFLFF